MKPIYLKTSDVAGWLNPWPITKIGNTKDRWVFNIEPLDTVIKWKNPNKLPNLGRVSFERIASLYKEGNLDGIDRHYLSVLARDWAPTARTHTILCTKQEDGSRIVWDGSSRLVALAVAKELGKDIQISRVGVITRVDRKKKKK